MAVYTDINKNELDSFLALYNIEEIVKFTGIKEGVENSNFLLEGNSAKYILTIFEKRTDENDLPFFFNLMNHLNDNEIKLWLSGDNIQNSKLSNSINIHKVSTYVNSAKNNDQKCIERI